MPCSSGIACRLIYKGCNESLLKFGTIISGRNDEDPTPIVQSVCDGALPGRHRPRWCDEETSGHQQVLLIWLVRLLWVPVWVPVWYNAPSVPSISSPYRS
ncbi:hypothetical protein JTE90_015371 [Oedothorax gibbosus]|uniref:Uncharacterized protein n=1 Tax=Oedothorax gibbosus TaxID=931172 RepID=A0AAV6U4N7_9ARAC|nr:hypothetical protein JTE90_015371 [Oedothorax gibbosus]